jgi:toxin-antitoxin system PIN domain toxin
MAAPRLLDANLLVALTVDSHIHHLAARRWFAQLSAPFATCPITQGSLLRLRMSLGASATFEDAQAILRAVVSHPRHIFWPDSLGYAELPARGIQGHRQVTDAYLVGLARHHRGLLATFDRGLAALHSRAVELVVA